MELEIGLKPGIPRNAAIYLLALMIIRQQEIPRGQSGSFAAFSEEIQQFENSIIRNSTLEPLQKVALLHALWYQGGIMGFPPRESGLEAGGANDEHA